MKQITEKTFTCAVREFREIDLIPLYRMIQETIDASYSAVYPHRAVQFFKEYHSEKRIMERSQKGEILVIERNGSIVATGALVGNEIVGVFVKPEYQGQGLGRAIMRELEGRAKTKGFSEVVLGVSLPSRRFYERLEYEVLDKRSLSVGEGQYLEYWPARKTLTS